MVAAGNKAVNYGLFIAAFMVASRACDPFTLSVAAKRQSDVSSAR